MSEINSLIYIFNDKCDICQKLFKMVAVNKDKKFCLDCLEDQFKEKYGIDFNDIKLDKKSEETLNKSVDKIVEEIKKNNDK